MHAAFGQFAAFTQDAIDNKALAAAGPLPMPVLGIGGDHSYATTMADLLRAVARDVTSRVIANAGHWLMEEQTDVTVAAIRDFLETR